MCEWGRLLCFKELQKTLGYTFHLDMTPTLRVLVTQIPKDVQIWSSSTSLLRTPPLTVPLVSHHLHLLGASATSSQCSWNRVCYPAYPPPALMTSPPPDYSKEKTLNHPDSRYFPRSPGSSHLVQFVTRPSYPITIMSFLSVLVTTALVQGLIILLLLDHHSGPQRLSYYSAPDCTDFSEIR